MHYSNNKLSWQKVCAFERKRWVEWARIFPGMLTEEEREHLHGIILINNLLLVVLINICYNARSTIITNRYYYNGNTQRSQISASTSRAFT